MPTTINKRVLLLILIIIGIIAIVLSLVIHMYHPLPEKDRLEMKLKVVDKPNLIVLYSQGNVTVIDCSKTSDDFVGGHRLPGAVWSVEPRIFYDSTRLIVVYSNNDTIAHDFCIELLRKVNVDVFLFKGGYQKWSEE